MKRVDVIVLGGGPAGLAVAGALARRDRTVALLERGRPEGPRIGETLGPEVAALLQSLGAWEALRPLFATQLPFRSVRSAWGSPTVEERSSLTHVLGEGWHVARAAFDAELAAWASREGAAIHAETGRFGLERLPDGFRVRPADGEEIAARFLVEASGRGAPATSALFAERRWIAADRQLAVFARFPGASAAAPEHELVLESVEDGWWYSAPQPDGSLVAAFLTDADLLPHGDAATLPARHAAALERTVQTRARCAGRGRPQEVRAVRADSGWLFPAQGARWLALGDAAEGTDPLAGAGVARALAAALRALPRIAAALDGGSADASATGFADYLDRRASYYLLEQRWPQARYWRRRHPPDWRGAPLHLAPTATLVRATVSDAAIDAAESLLPPLAVKTVLEAAGHAPLAAHEAMVKLRALAPLPDRRLLVGLQLLVESGALAAG